MLNIVPSTINRMSAQIVHNHPNSIAIQAFRKRVIRTPVDSLGGLGVMLATDEEDYEFDFLGNGSALQVDGAFSPSLMNDNADAAHLSGAEFRFLIQPNAQSNEPEWFDASVGDIIVLWLMDDGSLKIPFEIVGLETVNNLPPFSVRFICNRRDDFLMAVNDLDD